MKDFIKQTLATITGVILSVFILGFLGTLLFIGVIMGTTETETKVSPNSVMMLQLKGSLSERAPDNTLNILIGRKSTDYGLNDILASIKKAKTHPNIKGIYIEASYLATSFASLQEIRSALVDFKESGKFIVAYSDTYSQGMYYIASVADKVMLNPQGMIEWTGLAARPMFYKDLLDKIGVEMQIFKVGTYKSAVEPYINTEMSPANREQVTAYVNSIWNSLLSDISASRGISTDTLNSLADEMMMLLPVQRSIEAGLIDTLIYQNDVRNYIKNMMDIKELEPLPVLGLNDMVNVKKNVPKDKSGQAIAVYYMEGSIATSASSNSSQGIFSERVIKDLRRLQKDDDIKAVVLRVNSGGGSAYASEQIWHAVKELKEKKTVIVSMGDYAASGGYYISCLADRILALPTTLTGSIGIFGVLPNAEALYKKVGVKSDVVKTNEFSDFASYDRPMNSQEKALMQAYINQGYELFLSRCADGRKMTKEEIDHVGQGRVWTGAQALELGLVDELGGIDRAIRMAAELEEIENYSIVEYPMQESFFSSLLQEKTDNYIMTKFLKSNLGQYYKDVELLKELEGADRVQARLPFVIHWD